MSARAKKLSRMLVGAGIGLVLLYVGWISAPSFPLFLGLIAVPLLIEAGLLANKETGDTISESHWFLAQRPLVPYIYGLASFWVVFESNWGPLLVAAWCFLMAHFFFQSQDVYRRIWDLGNGFFKTEEEEK